MNLQSGHAPSLLERARLKSRFDVRSFIPGDRQRGLKRKIKIKRNATTKSKIK